MSLFDIFMPAKSRRRLFLTLVTRAVAQPRDFFRYVNLSSFRYFINYLRNADPDLVGKMVEEVLARDKAQAGEATRINNHFLKAISGRLEQRVPLRTETVDIIIPVYNAPELSAACIASVLANSENCRLILVNDASTDERIRQLLDSVLGAPDRGIEVLVHHNECNLGFVKTVNYAWTQTRGHFVILNSDTEVPPGWLERLFAPIFTSPDKIASVTPFSNAGMACSFPEPDRDHQIFKGMTVAELDAVFMQYGGSVPIDLFSGVGFCMAFNRQVVERIGMFDAETFGKGYGEEVDWSLRAYDAGYANVLMPNLFVYHKHGGSFSAEEKTKLLELNQDALWKRHGCHMTRLREMTLQDAPRAVRETIKIMAGLSGQEYGSRVAIMDVDISGGGTVYSAILTEQLKSKEFSVLHFRFNHRQGYLKLSKLSDREEITIVLPVEVAGRITEVIAELGIDSIIVNQLSTWPEPDALMKGLAGGETPYIIMMHDYFALCPSWFLLNRDGNFCGVPEGLEICSICLKSDNSSNHSEFYGHSLDNIADWRVAVGLFLSHSRAVICFSRPSTEYLKRVYPQLSNVSLNEHSIPNRERFLWKERRYDGSGTLNLAIIGHLFPVKGAGIVQELIESKQFKSQPVALTVFGDSPLYPPGHVSADGRVSFTGYYRQEELPALLEKSDIHAIVMSSIWPETFSYTTSEAILMGYPVLCFNLGAQAERVKKYGCGIVADAVSTDSLMDAIEKLIEKPELVSELSHNAQRYLPPTPDEHFGKIIDLIDCKPCRLRDSFIQPENVG